ncbi:DUF2795 domain-containing protein [Streptomyces sp. NPDC059740]|uniref:DUF2795 domain-containing protein n=1 Tax=Streptomyces sp. NPDC059740 TaxID=3346926 RepID=UPI0036666AD6
MQRGSDRLSVHRDDEMKHELQGMLRSGHSTRAEEWHDPEPSADDDPVVSVGPVPAPGSMGAMEELRFELARHLGRGPFPADRADLLRTLTEQGAPEMLRENVRSLPAKGRYANVHEVTQELVAREGTAEPG